MNTSRSWNFSYCIRGRCQIKNVSCNFPVSDSPAMGLNPTEIAINLANRELNSLSGECVWHRWQKVNRSKSLTG